jgi:hypothetical protein
MLGQCTALLRQSAAAHRRKNMFAAQCVPMTIRLFVSKKKNESIESNRSPVDRNAKGDVDMFIGFFKEHKEKLESKPKPPKPPPSKPMIPTEAPVEGKKPVEEKRPMSIGTPLVQANMKLSGKSADGKRIQATFTVYGKISGAMCFGEFMFIRIIHIIYAMRLD